MPLNIRPFVPPDTQLPPSTVPQQMAAMQAQQAQQQKEGIPGMQGALKALSGMYGKMLGGPQQQGQTPVVPGTPTTPASPAAAVTGLGQAGGTYAQGPSHPILSQIARPGVNVVGVDPRLGDQVAALYQSAPPEIQSQLQIGSGIRTMAEQQKVYANYLAGKGPLAAPPGQSRHQAERGGTALDLYYGQPGTPQRQQTMQWVHQNAPRFNLGFPLLKRGEDWHVELLR